MGEKSWPHSCGNIWIKKMANLNHQEKQPEILKLRQLLQSFPVEMKKEDEWQLLENTIIARLEDTEKSTRQKKTLPLPGTVLQLFQRPILATSALACLIIMLGAGSLYYTFHSLPQPLTYSKVIGTNGDVSFKTSGTNKEIEPQGTILFDNQVFKTAENATCIVQVDRGSIFSLSEKSKLAVQKADSREIELYLHRGSIIATVSKRKRNQSFSIVTPDARCKVVGTIFSVSIHEDHDNKKITTLTVMEGEVEIYKRNDITIRDVVKTGQTISLQNGIPDDPRRASRDQLEVHSVSVLKIAAEMSGENTVPTGLLDITSEPPGASIHIEGIYIGKTPTALRYPAGSYTVKLTMPEFETWERNIILKELHSTFVPANLTKIKKEIIVQPTTPRKKISNKIFKYLVQNKTIEEKAKDVPETKDFGFIMNSAFVEALIQMNIGEYQKALVILDSLKELPHISSTEKIRIMNKISECYKGMGNFQVTLKNLTNRYDKAEDRIKKSNLLWEIINVKANCLQDYEGAEKDITTYIKTYPKGAWIESAYSKRGEIQYITGKYSKAIGTFRYHINLFKSSNMVENSIYTLANILRMDVKEYTMALKWYSKLLKEYPSSKYYGNALFERAECFEKLDMHLKARDDYNKYLELFPDGHLKTLCLSRLSSHE